VKNGSAYWDHGKVWATASVPNVITSSDVSHTEKVRSPLKPGSNEHL